METTVKKIVNLIGGAILAGLILLMPRPSGAQDLRGEIDAIVKDYLASHPDEVGEIVKNYLIAHPEAVGQILSELLKHRPAASASAAAPTEIEHQERRRAQRRGSGQCRPAIHIAAPGHARQSGRHGHAGRVL